MGLQLASFLVAGIIVVTGALGVVLSKHPVHAALFLIQTLFGVAVEFLVVQAHFLAAIQVIVYAGAIVILFLFVIMLLGVDQAENLRVDPIFGQRSAALVTGAALFGLLFAAIITSRDLTGLRSVNGSTIQPDATGEVPQNINQLAENIFTDNVFAFEVTGLLLTVAVVGAVVMARRISGPLQPIPGVTPSEVSVDIDDTEDA